MLSPATESSRWLGMTMSVSTAARSSSMPVSACLRRRLPSKRKGLVTTPTVREPCCRATSAMMGAPPVPVPPPMPAVTNTMSAPARVSEMDSFTSSAASRPRSGLAPAPRPRDTVLPSCSLVWALFAASACTSVLAAMNSTPSRRPATMVLMALPPPPPTPMTLIFAAGSRLSKSIMSSSLRLEDLSEPFLHAVLDLAVDVLLADLEVGAVGALAGPVDHQPHRGGVLGALHHVHQPADAPWQPAPHRHPQHLLGHLRHAGEEGGAAGDHHPGGDALLQPALLDLVLDQHEDLLHAGLHDLGEDLPGEHPRLPAAHAGDLDGLPAVHHGGHGAAVGLLDALRLVGGRAQPHRHVVREVVAAQGEHRGVGDGPVREDRDVGGAAADVHQAHPQLLLVLGEGGERARQRLQHDVRHVQAGALGALDDVLRRGHRAGDDQRLGLQAHAAHADGVLDAVLVVDHELLGEDVDDLAVEGDGHRLGLLDDPVDVLG